MVAVLAVLNGVWMENKAIKVIVSSYYVIMIRVHACGEEESCQYYGRSLYV